MMDDSEYSNRATEKLHYYQRSGYFFWKNLIISTESQDNPISSKQIEELAREYLL